MAVGNILPAFLIGYTCKATSSIDNAKIHLARIIFEFLEASGLINLFFRVILNLKILDLSPMKNECDMMGRRLKNVSHPAQRC